MIIFINIDKIIFINTTVIDRSICYRRGMKSHRKRSEEASKSGIKKNRRSSEMRQVKLAHRKLVYPLAVRYLYLPHYFLLFKFIGTTALFYFPGLLASSEPFLWDFIPLLISPGLAKHLNFFPSTWFQNSFYLCFYMLFYATVRLVRLIPPCREAGFIPPLFLRVSICYPP